MSLIPENDRAPSSSHMFRAPPIRKLFTSDIQEESQHYDSKLDSFQVFVRIKPNIEVNNATNCIKIVDSQKLVCKPPTNSKHKKAEKVEFTFSRIFGPRTTQQNIFNVSIVPFIETLVNGRDSLIFAYGTTNAGKTYTVQGNSSNPGIIPRTLHTLFSNIRPQKMMYKPIMGKTIYKMSACDQQKQMVVRQEIFESSKSKLTDFTESSQFMMMLEESFVELNSGMPKCEVWISFVELYNETPHDLLSYPVKKLAVAEDRYHNFFVKDLKHVYVQSAEEAFKFYQYGRKNLCFATTKLNDRSSRSHCIFTIYVINVEDPRSPTVSNLSICDLAGTERQTKTQNEGMRLKETGGINSSLFQLNRCLRTIRENQTKNLTQPVPYRYSSLTKLFRSALDERTDEKILMIVNVNSSPQLYDETQQVLKMCALASKIKNKPIITKILPRCSRFSTFVYGQDNTSLNEDEQDEFSEYEEDVISEGSVESEIEVLKEQLAAKEMEVNNTKRHVNEIMKIYDNLQANSAQHIESLEKNYNEQKDRFERLLKNQKEYYESKLQELKKNTICGSDPETDIDRLLLEKDLLITSLEALLQEAKTEYNEKNAKIESLESLLREAKTEYNEKNANIESLESLLQEAKTEYIALTNAWTTVSSKLADTERELQDKCDFSEALEQELTAKQYTIDDLESRIEHLEETQSQNTIKYEEDLVTLEKQRDDFKEEVERIKIKLAELTNTVDKTREREEYVNALEKERDILKEELERAQNCTAELVSATEKIKKKEIDLNSMVEERNTLKEKLEKARITIEELMNVADKAKKYEENVVILEKQRDNLIEELEQTKKELTEVMDQARGKLKEQNRRYNTRKGNRTPLSKSEKENKENEFFTLITPVDMSKKLKKPRGKEKNIFTDIYEKEKTVFTDGFDDSLESNIFRCESEGTFAEIKDMSTHGGKKKLFSTPVCEVDDLISLDSVEKNQIEYCDVFKNQLNTKTDVATPAQTIKSALRSKKKQY